MADDLRLFFEVLRRSMRLGKEESAQIPSDILRALPVPSRERSLRGSRGASRLYAYEKALLFDALRGFMREYPSWVRRSPRRTSGPLPLALWRGANPFRHLRPFLIRI